jgi:hypothetical protein
LSQVLSLVDRLSYFLTYRDEQIAEGNLCHGNEYPIDRGLQGRAPKSPLKRGTLNRFFWFSLFKGIRGLD